MLEAATELDKHRYEPHMELARLYIVTGDRGLAMAAANKAVKLAPLSSLAWNTKGRAELNRFAYDDAIEAFSKAVELDQDNVWAWNNLGYTELQLEHYDDAARDLAEATSRAGATGYMFNNLGTALEHLDRLDEARAAFESGGARGSKQALASRKRLEGVKSIALFVPSHAGKPDVRSDVVHTFDDTEGPLQPEDVDQDANPTDDDAVPATAPAPMPERTPGADADPAPAAAPSSGEAASDAGSAPTM